MANPYDQFDQAPAPNPYDQFDQPAAAAPSNPYDQFDAPASPPSAPVEPVQAPATARDNATPETPAPSGAATLPDGRPIPEIRAYEEPGIFRRAVTAVREAASPILGPTPNQRLRQDLDRQLLERDFPALAAMAEQSRPNLVETEGFVPAMFTPSESSPWKLPTIAPDAERGNAAQVASGLYNTATGVVNSVTSSPGGLLSLPAAPAMVASRAATGIFAGDMARQALESLPQTIATVRDDDASLQEKTEAIGGTALTATLAAAGARQVARAGSATPPAYRGGAPEAPSVPAAADVPKPAVELVTRSAVEPLTSVDVPGAVQAALDAPRDPSATAPTAEVKPLGLLESARAAETVAPEVKAKLQGEYVVARNAETMAEAARRIDAAATLDDVRREVMANENPDAVSNAMGLDLVRRYQGAGQFEAAAEVLNHMATKAKTQGQAIQILSTLSRATPEGAAAYAQRLFGRKLTGEEFGRLKNEMEWVQKATDESVRLGRQAIVLGRLQEVLPMGLDSKINAARNMAMLLNPKTQIRNVVGNVFMATGDIGADVVAMPVDYLVSMATGKRTVSGPQMVEYVRGMATPAREFSAAYKQARSEGLGAVRSLSSATDVLHALTKLGDTSKMEIGDVKRAYRLTFTAPVARHLEKTLGLAMGVPDRAFYMGRLQASLKSQMRAADAVVPTAEMLDRASLEAARSTYQDRNFISVSLNEMRRIANRASTLGRSSEVGVGSAVIPFTQVPGALLLRGAEFSPLGFAKAAAEALVPVFTKRAFNQREFSQAFGKALVGTGGLAALGYWLNGLGVVTGAKNEDRDVARLERELGYGGYKINVSELKRRIQSMDWATPSTGPISGDTMVNYDWVQPLALPVAFGADLRTSEKQQETSGLERVTRGMFTGVKALEEQPLLVGLSGFLRSAGNQGFFEAAYNSMLGYPAAFVPTALREMRELEDNRVYETRGSDRMEAAYQQALSNLPLVSEKLGYKPRVDMLGTPLERYQGGDNTFFNVFVNPAMVTQFKSDPYLRELYSVWKETGERGQIPNQVETSITINDQKRSLTAAERADYQQFVGRLTREGFRMMMTSPDYAAAPYEVRAQKLAQFVKGADEAARIRLFDHRPKNNNSATIAAFLISRKMDREQPAVQ